MSDDPTYDGPNRRRTDQREALLVAASDIQAGMHDLTVKFATVEAFSRETRQITHNHEKTNRRLAAVVGVLVLMIAALAVTTVRANRANDKATRTQEYQIANCQLANESRAANIKLWDNINMLMLAPTPERPKPTKALLKFTADLKAQVADTFQARDCTQVEEGKVG